MRNLSISNVCFWDKFIPTTEPYIVHGMQDVPSRFLKIAALSRLYGDQNVIRGDGSVDINIKVKGF